MASASFTLRMDADLKLKLDEQAKRERRSTAAILHRAAEEYVERQQAFDAMVDRLSAEADKGVFVSGEKVNAWFESLETEGELPFPEPDVFVGPAARGK